eukprot:COSAG06_NODE_28525_length_572_cov_4.063425_1_plen_116_part_00
MSCHVSENQVQFIFPRVCVGFVCVFFCVCFCWYGLPKPRPSSAPAPAPAAAERWRLSCARVYYTSTAVVRTVRCTTPWRTAVARQFERRAASSQHASLDLVNPTCLSVLSFLLLS